MEKRYVRIGSIPAVLWGADSERLLLLVHGAMSNKEDAAIAAAAECAVKRGYLALSFDLPEHGEREDGVRLCPQTAIPEIRRIYEEYGAMRRTALFGCSIGAYFGMLALGEERAERGYLLSPIVDMAGLIEGMMASHGVTYAELEQKKVIELSPYEVLDWAYYRYIKDNPLKWEVPTDILWGRRDSMSSEYQIDSFAESRGAAVRKVDSEHYFHTEEQLDLLRRWLLEVL